MASHPSIILGISTGHGDSSAALIMDGSVIAAAEEERFTRVKHYALFPSMAIDFCLRRADITPKDVEVVALARKPMNQFWRRCVLAWTHPHLAREKLGHRSTQKHSLT